MSSNYLTEKDKLIKKAFNKQIKSLSNYRIQKAQFEQTHLASNYDHHIEE